MVTTLVYIAGIYICDSGDSVGVAAQVLVVEQCSSAVWVASFRVGPLVLVANVVRDIDVFTHLFFVTKVGSGQWRARVQLSGFQGRG